MTKTARRSTAGPSRLVLNGLRSSIRARCLSTLRLCCEFRVRSAARPHRHRSGAQWAEWQRHPAVGPRYRSHQHGRERCDARGYRIRSGAGCGQGLDVVAFSSDGELIAVRSGPHLVKGSQVAILRTADASVVSSFGTRFVCALAFAPDGQTIATGHWNNVTLWDVRTGARLALLMSPPRKVDPNRYDRDGRYLGAVAMSQDGKLIAAGSDDGELQIWDVSARKLIHTRSLSWAGVTAVAFSPDSSMIATGSYEDGTLRLVESATGKLLSEIQVSMFGVGALAFSPDGKYLVTPSNEGTLNNGKYSRGGTIRVFRVERCAPTATSIRLQLRATPGI